MFSNWSGWKTVKAVLFTLIALVPTVVPQEYQAMATSIIGVVGTLVVLLSGTPIGPTMASNAAGMAKDAAKAAAVLLFLCAFTATQGGCPPGAVVPVANLDACVANVVASNAGAPWLTIVGDALAACGGDIVAIIDSLAKGHPEAAAELASLRAQAVADPAALRAKVLAARRGQ